MPRIDRHDSAKTGALERQRSAGDKGHQRTARGPPICRRGNRLPSSCAVARTIDRVAPVYGRRLVARENTTGPRREGRRRKGRWSARGKAARRRWPGPGSGPAVSQFNTGGPPPSTHREESETAGSAACPTAPAGGAKSDAQLAGPALSRSERAKSGAHQAFALPSRVLGGGE